MCRACKVHDKSRYFGVQLEIEIKDLDNIFDVGARFLLKCFSLLIFISCIDFQSDTIPGTCQKVCGGGGWLNVNFVFCFGPKLYLEDLSFGIGPS